MKNAALVKIVVVTLVLLLPALVFARPHRVDQLPNNEYGCNICHNDTGGFNEVGFDSVNHIDDNGDLVWSTLAAEDSDGDGYTNGLELGDPNGTWQIGDPDPSAATSDPRDANDNFCGNGSFEGNEECDGMSFNGETCDTLGLGGGTLRCNPTTCQFDVTACGGGSCGDGMKQQDEDCEGMDLGGATCEALGYDGGVLSCTSRCTFDTLSCSGTNDSEGPGFSLCGDGLQTGIEECDTFDMGGETCQSLGWEGGMLNCTSSCTFSYTQCEGPPSTEGEDENARPADDPEPSPGGISEPTQNPVSESIDFQGRACAVGGAGNVAPSALIVLFIGLGLMRRRLHLARRVESGAR